MLDLDYLRGDFDAFYPAEVTCCTNGDEIWRGGVDRHLLHTNLPHWCRGGGPMWEQTPQDTSLVRFL